MAELARSGTQPNWVRSITADVPNPATVTGAGSICCSYTVIAVPPLIEPVRDPTPMSGVECVNHVPPLTTLAIGLLHVSANAGAPAPIKAVLLAVLVKATTVSVRRRPVDLMFLFPLMASPWILLQPRWLLSGAL